MVNSTDVDDDDFPDYVEPVKEGEVVVEATPPPVQCPACNGTGAVPENVLAGKVDKWKDCPMCMASGTNPLNTNDPNKCKDCNGSGQTVESFVDGKPVTYKTCATCKGSGNLVPNE